MELEHSRDKGGDGRDLEPRDLDAVADLLRITRNEAGHPTGREVDEDTALHPSADGGQVSAEDGDPERPLSGDHPATVTNPVWRSAAMALLLCGDAPRSTHP